MALKIKVFSDYVCPFCFLAKAPFDAAVVDKDVEVEWMPYELCPSPSPKLDPVNDPAKRNAWETSIKPMAEKFGVEMQLPNFSPHPYTDLAFEGYHFAKEFGKGKEYNDRIFIALFQESQNIGEIEVLTKLGGEIGLDTSLFANALHSRKYKAVQVKALEFAYTEERIRVVPTFIIGEERIEGVASKEHFEKVILKEMNRNGGK
ncbi:MAG: putative sulfur oxido-reductase [Bacillales bacterium]|jgi:predicted DsbA family dithiol-disulfide isomerase|nr:putative sulfur oxido-reductase [Bacillales bacterium]